MPEPTSSKPATPPTTPPEKPSASSTATKTQTKTKTKTVIAVGLIAGAAMGIAAAFALLSLPKKGVMVCVGGPVQGRVCTSDRQCLGGRCLAVSQTRPTSTKATQPATKPTATQPTTRPAQNATMWVIEAPRSNETNPGIVIAGTSSATLAKFSFVTSGANFQVRKLRFNVGSRANVTRLILKDSALAGTQPATVLASGVPDANGNVDFTNLNFVAPLNGVKDILVFADLARLGGTANSGANVKVTLKSDAGTFLANNMDGGNPVTSIAADISGADKIVRKSRPYFTGLPLPAITLNVGNNVALRFSVTAASNGDVSLKKLTFRVQKNTLAVFKAAVGQNETPIRVMGQSNNLAGNVLITGSDIPADRCNQLVGMRGECLMTVSFMTEEVIAAGTTKSYEVRLQVGGSLSAGDSMTTTLTSQYDTALDTGFVTLGPPPAPQFMIDTTNTSSADSRKHEFIWSDFSWNPHRAPTADVNTRPFTGSFDWINGQYLGVQANSTLTSTTGSPAPVTLRTKPTVSLVALPSTTLMNFAGAAIARFSVTAASTGDLALKKVSFKVFTNDTNNNGTLSNVKLFNGTTDLTSSASVTSSGSNCGFAASAQEKCVRVQLVNEYTVLAGTTKTFELKADLGNFDNSGDVLALSLLGDSTAAFGELDYGSLAAPSLQIDAVASGTDGEYNFIWSDMSANPHNSLVASNMDSDTASASNDWTNGNGIMNLPGAAQTMVR